MNTLILGIALYMWVSAAIGYRYNDTCDNNWWTAFLIASPLSPVTTMIFWLIDKFQKR